jgi:hypothetical protein
MSFKTEPTHGASNLKSKLTKKVNAKSLKVGAESPVLVILILGMELHILKVEHM